MLSDTDKGQLAVALCRFVNEARKEGTITHGIKCLDDAMKEIESLFEAQSMDALLDSVHPEISIRQVWRLRAGGWEACISVPDGPDDDGWYNYTGSEVVGTGPTREAALRDAVQKAKGAGE